MPSYWYNLHECRVKEDDDEEVSKQKEFNFKIAAAKKPYFMTYIYPKLKSENDTYIRNNNMGVLRRFSKYGIKSILELEEYENKTDAMAEYLDYYHKRELVGNNSCVVNRISWIFEKVFNGYLSKFSKYIRESNQSEFDYNILKSGTTYGRITYKQILELYKDYIRRVEEYQRKSRTQKVEKYDAMLKHKMFADFFRSECDKVCPNEKELCDIVLDICYSTEKSKQFAWDICGTVIIDNLLNQSNRKVQFPQMVSEGGDFTYCGKQFKMYEKEIGGEEA